MPRFVAPAGTPLTIKHVLHAVKSACSANGSAPKCLDSLAQQLGARYAFGVSSGRAALWLILRGLHRLRPDRCAVALPAYTCFSVPAAIVRAGLKLYPVEIEAETLDFDFAQLEAVPQKKLLCIISASLFGLVNDGSRSLRIARGKDAFLIDDAAQALGALRNGRPAGTFGDVGLYSFARGKALAGPGGGLIITDSEEIAGAIQGEFNTLPALSFAQSAASLLQMLVYSLFLTPRMYWIPNSIPFLKLGITEYVPTFPTTRFSAVSGALLAQLIGSLGEINRIRQRNASVLAQSLRGSPDFVLPMAAPDCQPTYVRFPLIAKDEATRHQVLLRLRQAGIGASPFYPSAICEIAGIGRHMAPSDFHRPRAEALSRTLLTLPTHSYVNERDLARMVDILNAREWKS